MTRVTAHGFKDLKQLSRGEPLAAITNPQNPLLPVVSPAKRNPDRLGIMRSRIANCDHKDRGQNVFIDGGQTGPIAAKPRPDTDPIRQGQHPHRTAQALPGIALLAFLHPIWPRVTGANKLHQLIQHQVQLACVPAQEFKGMARTIWQTNPFISEILINPGRQLSDGTNRAAHIMDDLVNDLGQLGRNITSGCVRLSH